MKYVNSVSRKSLNFNSYDIFDVLRRPYLTDYLAGNFSLCINSEKNNLQAKLKGENAIRVTGRRAGEGRAGSHRTSFDGGTRSVSSSRARTHASTGSVGNVSSALRPRFCLTLSVNQHVRSLHAPPHMSPFHVPLLPMRHFLRPPVQAFPCFPRYN